MAGQQICLKWNSFQSNIVTSFEKLWEEEGFVDVTLASDGQCIQAHKVMLSACSPFFRKVFQSNPCQHPVIILQDVHFSELESLLCFVYKGEVNIDQENLPALLRAAETLQIRGLSGASDQVKEKMGVPKKLSVAPSSEDCVEDSSSPPPPAKRQRSAQLSHPSPPASPLALTPTSRPTRPRRPSSSSSVEPEYPPLKTELNDSRSNSRLSIGESMEDSREAVTTLNLSQKLEEADLGQSKVLLSSLFDSRLKKISAVCLESARQHLLLGTEGGNIYLLNLRTFEMSDTIIYQDVVMQNDMDIELGLGLLLPYQKLPYAFLLPRAHVLATWSKARTLEQFACDLMKILFSTEERILCNVNGKMGKRQFNVHKIQLIREVLHFFSSLPPSEFEEQWKSCVTKIDTANRGLKRNLVLRERRATSFVVGRFANRYKSLCRVKKEQLDTHCQLSQNDESDIDEHI
uniref:(California timema) hypothetical protein n=1 Tax=Timema californicum TaxID=61474 RepID=A0A7R9P593_TIMCA|nr:unnamed protein product [Timema californicum]